MGRIPPEGSRVAWEDDRARMVLAWDGVHRRPAVYLFLGCMKVWSVVPGRRGKRGGWTIYMPDHASDLLRGYLDDSLEIFEEHGWGVLWVANACSGCGAKPWDTCVHKTKRPPEPLRTFHRERRQRLPML